MIRRLLLTTTALAAMSGLALAADMPRTYAPPAFTWTGFYIGGTVGAVSSNTGVANPTCDFAGCTAFPFSSTAATVGGTLGYNYQMGNIVLGLEGDWNVTNLNASNGHNLNITTKMDDFGSVRGRLGYAFDKTLLFVTGGVAFANMTTSAGFSDESQSTYARIHTNTGWIIGGGIEQALTNNISVKIEALYADYSKKAATETECSCRYGFKNTALIARVGVNYKF
jgi:outer membrane immunogenic protein